jgi:hypothetical protein
VVVSGAGGSGLDRKSLSNQTSPRGGSFGATWLMDDMDVKLTRTAGGSGNVNVLSHGAAERCCFSRGGASRDRIDRLNGAGAECVLRDSLVVLFCTYCANACSCDHIKLL